MSERRRTAPGGRKTARRARAKSSARPVAPAKKRAKPARRKAAKAAAPKSAAPKTGGAKAKRAAKAVDPHAAVRRYRERMRARGLRPVTIWAHDLGDPDVQALLAREFAAVQASGAAEVALSPLLDAQDFPDWTA